MKKTFISLTCISALTGSLSAQTVAPISWDTSSLNTISSTPGAHQQYEMTGTGLGDTWRITWYGGLADPSYPSGSNIQATSSAVRGIHGYTTGLGAGFYTISRTSGSNSYLQSASMVLFNDDTNNRHSYIGSADEFSSLDSNGQFVTNISYGSSIRSTGTNGSAVTTTGIFNSGLTNATLVTFSDPYNPTTSEGWGQVWVGLHNIQVTDQVPEPSSTVLLGLGALGFILRRKR